MFYPSNVPSYNRFRLRAEPINTANTITLTVSMPADFRPFFVGMFSLLTETNVWVEASGITPQDMVDVANNEVVFMNLCEALADCIRNNADVQSALQQVLIQNQLIEPDSENRPIDAPPNSLLQSGCSLDDVYGAAVAIEDYVHAVGRDFVEILVNQGTLLTAVARAIAYIPILGDLPVVNDLRPFVDWVLANGLVAYDSGYTTTIRQNNICELFSIGCSTCDLTVQDVVSYYATESGLSYVLSDPFRALVSVATGTATAEAFTFAVKGVIVAALATGSSVGDLTGLSSFEAVAASGDPDSDWNIFCNPCPQVWCYEWSPPAPPVDWTNVIGAPVVSGGRLNVTDYPQSNEYLRGVDIQLAASTTITEIEIEYDLSKGVYQDPGYAALFGLSNNGFVFSVPPASLSSGQSQLYSWTGNEAITSLRIAFRSDVATTPAARTGSGGIRRITLRGTGVSPFGPSNC